MTSETTPVNQNANVAKAAATPPAATPTPAAEKTVETSSASFAASTPTEAYKSAYAARKNKDIATLKKLIAKDMFEFLEILGEGQPDPLEAGLKSLCESPQGPTDEVRNETIKGDKATIKYLDSNEKWTTMDLVKEDGIWKLTIAKMDDSGKDK